MKTIVHINAIMNAFNDNKEHKQVLDLFDTINGIEKDVISCSVTSHKEYLILN